MKNSENSNSDYKKDLVDYSARVVSLNRWHSDRLTGESTGNVGDARGDESLYKPSSLGMAMASISTVMAGEDKSFELIYRAGSFVLKAGAMVKFWMAGQGSLGTSPQVNDPQFPGYLDLAAPESVAIELFCDKTRVLSLEHGENSEKCFQSGDLTVGPITIGFKILKGSLEEGDEVRISVGKTAGFIWKKLSGRKEFKIIIETGDDKPKMRLPEPVIIEILPLEPDYIDLFLPATSKPGTEIEAVVSIRDRYDNRVSYDGPLSIEADSKKTTAYLCKGLGQTNIGKSGTKPVRAKAQCNIVSREAESNWCLPSDNLNLYFGDMHTHDFNSTAEAYPADVYHWAMDEKALDFVSVPIQVHRWIDNEKWSLAKHMNEYFLEEGRFVTFLSFEWQHSHYGDKVIHYLGGDMPYLPVDDPRYNNPQKLYQALRKTDAFIISHHPGYELDLHVPGTEWETIETDVDRFIEIWSMHGSSEGCDPHDRPLIPPWRRDGAMAGLRRGLRMGIVAGSDTHTGRPGGSAHEVRPYWGGLCAIWAKKLTRRSLFEAFIARRTYALTGARIALRFFVNGHPMGSEISSSEECKILAEVWAPSKIAKVQFLRNTEMCYEEKAGNNICRVEFVDRCNSEVPVFYHCRVIQADGHLAVCSPVWVG